MRRIIFFILSSALLIAGFTSLAQSNVEVTNHGAVVSSALTTCNGVGKEFIAEFTIPSGLSTVTIDLESGYLTGAVGSSSSVYTKINEMMFESVAASVPAGITVSESQEGKFTFTKSGGLPNTFTWKYKVALGSSFYSSPNFDANKADLINRISINNTLLSSLNNTYELKYLSIKLSKGNEPTSNLANNITGQITFPIEIKNLVGSLDLTLQNLPLTITNATLSGSQVVFSDASKKITISGVNDISGTLVLTYTTNCGSPYQNVYAMVSTGCIQANDLTAYSYIPNTFFESTFSSFGSSVDGNSILTSQESQLMLNGNEVLNTFSFAQIDGVQLISVTADNSATTNAFTQVQNGSNVYTIPSSGLTSNVVFNGNTAQFKYSVSNNMYLNTLDAGLNLTYTFRRNGCNYTGYSYSGNIPQGEYFSKCSLIPNCNSPETNNTIYRTVTGDPTVAVSTAPTTNISLYYKPILNLNPIVVNGLVNGDYRLKIDVPSYLNVTSVLFPNIQGSFVTENPISGVGNSTTIYVTVPKSYFQAATQNSSIPSILINAQISNSGLPASTSFVFSQTSYSFVSKQSDNSYGSPIYASPYSFVINKDALGGFPTFQSSVFERATFGPASELSTATVGALEQLRTQLTSTDNFIKNTIKPGDVFVYKGSINVGATSQLLNQYKLSFSNLNEAGTAFMNLNYKPVSITVNGITRAISQANFLNTAEIFLAEANNTQQVSGVINVEVVFLASIDEPQNNSFVSLNTQRMLVTVVQNGIEKHKQLHEFNLFTKNHYKRVNKPMYSGNCVVSVASTEVDHLSNWINGMQGMDVFPDEFRAYWYPQQFVLSNVPSSIRLTNAQLVEYDKIANNQLYTLSINGSSYSYSLSSPSSSKVKRITSANENSTWYFDYGFTNSKQFYYPYSNQIIGSTISYLVTDVDVEKNVKSVNLSSAFSSKSKDLSGYRYNTAQFNYNVYPGSGATSTEDVGLSPNASFYVNTTFLSQTTAKTYVLYKFDAAIPLDFSSSKLPPGSRYFNAGSVKYVLTSGQLFDIKHQNEYNYYNSYYSSNFKFDCSRLPTTQYTFTYEVYPFVSCNPNLTSSSSNISLAEIMSTIPSDTNTFTYFPKNVTMKVDRKQGSGYSEQGGYASISDCASIGYDLEASSNNGIGVLNAVFTFSLPNGGLNTSDIVFSNSSSNAYALKASFTSSANPQFSIGQPTATITKSGDIVTLLLTWNNVNSANIKGVVTLQTGCEFVSGIKIGAYMVSQGICNRDVRTSINQTLPLYFDSFGAPDFVTVSSSPASTTVKAGSTYNLPYSIRLANPITNIQSGAVSKVVVVDPVNEVTLNSVECTNCGSTVLPMQLIYTYSNGRKVYRFPANVSQLAANKIYKFKVNVTVNPRPANAKSLSKKIRFAFGSWKSNSSCGTSSCNLYAESGSTFHIINIQDDECEDCITSFSPLINKEYVLSAWVTLSLGVTDIASLSGFNLQVYFKDQDENQFSTINLVPTGTIVEGWAKVEGTFTVPDNAKDIVIKTSNTSKDAVYMDDFRIHPFNASMKTFVYDPISFRLVAELDDNNFATLYEYDEEGNLIRIKKETERGIMTIQESRRNTTKTDN